MKKMKNLGFLLAFALIAFASCEKDDNGGSNSGGNVSTITATNVINGSTRVITVKALAWWSNGEWDYGSDAIAQTPYKNNGFTLELPSTVSAKYLYFIDEEYDTEDVFISDKNAKGMILEWLEGYDKDEKEIGSFYLIEENDNSAYYAYWVYADRDVTVKREEKYEGYDEYDGSEWIGIEKIDLTLRKGWNAVYESFIDTKSYNNSTKREVYTYTESFTSQKPSGVNYSWYFDSDYDYNSVQAASKSVENTKSVLSKLKENKKNRARK